MKRCLDQVCGEKVTKPCSQPEQVESEPVGYVDYGDRVEWYKKPAPETDLYTTPQPDRTAELEQLRQRVADLEKERDDWQDEALGSRINVETLRVERDAALNEARDFESDVDNIAQHNVELQLEIITLKSALRDAKKVLIGVVQGDYDGSAAETITKINEVLHD